jgi:endonuclease YncB( thermonuclease family)
MQTPLVRLLTLAFCSIAIFSAPGRADMVQAQILEVHDGDTVTAQIAHGRPFHVRLNGIDAPELSMTFGAESRDHLRAEVLGQPVILDIAQLDVYGRTIARILHDGKDANLDMIEGGFAWCYRKYLRNLSLTNRDAYQHAEDDAKSHSRGLWNLPTPLAPWDFRKAHRYGR